jgi:ferredoxin hydrogenase
MTVFGRTVPPREDACIHCGQCTFFCPRDAITERFHYRAVAGAIADPGKIVIASVAPAIRVALGEMYGLPIGANVERRIVASLRALGVDDVLDTTFFADLTAMEEASELLQRLDDSGSSLPMFTSCCPAWVRFAKLFYPSLLPNLWTCKSPILMQGAMIKTYFAQQKSIDPAKIVTVAFAPCTAKKAEILLPGMNAAGIFHGAPQMRDVDIVLTTRELAHLLNAANIDFPGMSENDARFGSLIGAGSGAGMIFGGTGGVMEATLRTAYRMVTGANPPGDFFNFAPARGFDNVREAVVSLGDRSLNIAIVHGTRAARTFINTLQSGVRKYDFVEIMACSGGCIGGGGHPVNRNMNATDLNRQRRNALFAHGDRDEIRLSYDNPQIREIYDNFFGEPLSVKAKEMLHTVH